MDALEELEDAGPDDEFIGAATLRLQLRDVAYPGWSDHFLERFDGPINHAFEMLNAQLTEGAPVRFVLIVNIAPGLALSEATMSQLELDLTAARSVGGYAEAAAAAKAARSGFDLELARLRALNLLRSLGPSNGEVLVELLKKTGFVPHDDRAFGAVFSGLARRGQIRCVGYCARAKGHGTAGGRIWEAVA